MLFPFIYGNAQVNKEQVEDLPPDEIIQSSLLSHERDTPHIEFDYLQLPLEIIKQNNMVFIEGGTYEKGFKKGRDYNMDSELHEVKVDAFYISQFEVTLGSFKEFVDSTGYQTTAEKLGNCMIIKEGKFIKNQKEYSWKSVNFKQTPEHPVTCVSWVDAVEYCNWLSKHEGLEQCYTIKYNGFSISVACNWQANGYRLPTEAEWEYAARGGKYSRNYRYAGISNKDYLYKFCNYSDAKMDNFINTAPVGNYEPNEIGLYDMSGNVSEWCWNYADYREENSTFDNPKGAERGTSRIMKGGDWNTIPLVMEVARYQHSKPMNALSLTGFRICKTKK